MSTLLQFTGPFEPILVKLTSTAATEIAGSDIGSVTIPTVTFAEISGNATTVTLETVKGSTHVYHAHTYAVAASGRLVIDDGIYIPPTYRLKATCATADRIDVTGLKSIPNTTR